VLERLYAAYNTPQARGGDPVAFVHRYDCVKDREVVGLVAASLGYGRLAQILKSVGDALERMGPSPSGFLLSASELRLRTACCGFVHRFARDDNLLGLFMGIRAALRAHGSLEACFLSHDSPGEQTVWGALTGFATELAEPGGAGHLMPDPGRGSACKRWHLYLRWMVRRDAVDPGPWRHVAPARLVVPLDAHVWRVCRSLGLTARRTCNRRAALEATAGFRALCPEDPVRYDFALMHASEQGDPALSRWLLRERGE